MKSPSNANHLCVVRAKRESLSPAWQLTHLHLATSPIARNHGTKARTGSKPLQECFTLRSGSGRWGTYYAGQLSKVLLPLVVLKREGSASLPPVPTRAWALTGTGRQTHAPVPAGRKVLGSLTRACSCSSDGQVTEIHCKAVKKNLQQNNETLKHAVHGECSEYNYFIRTTTRKVKLKTKQAKPTKRYSRGGIKTSNNHIPPRGFMQSLTHSLSHSSWWPISGFGISHFWIDQ